MSTSDSKKKSSSSSSSKPSKRNHQEEANDDDVPVEEIHTANNWEQADLGDDHRKQKFLRLMGAKKHKDEIEVERQESHTSNQDEDISPEKKHCRSKVETETINRDLEKQFNESLQSKIAHTYHGGLGFHGDSVGATSSGDWQHQPAKLKFVPAKTDVGSSMDHVVVEDTTKKEEKSSDKEEKSSDTQEKSSDKPEKKKKSKS